MQEDTEFITFSTPPTALTIIPSINKTEVSFINTDEEELYSILTFICEWKSQKIGIGTHFLFENTQKERQF